MSSIISKDNELACGVDWCGGHTIMVWSAYHAATERSTLKTMSLREFFNDTGITAEDCKAAFEEEIGPMQSPVGGTPYLGMPIFPLGAIIVASDVSVDDWDIMEALAFEAGCKIRQTKLKRRCVEGRVLINYEGHVYKTICRYGELRFKRMT